MNDRDKIHVFIFEIIIEFQIYKNRCMVSLREKYIKGMFKMNMDYLGG